jgi:hypothetical protein
MPVTPCTAAVSKVSIEVSRYSNCRVSDRSKHVHWRSCTYIESSEVLPILIEGGIIEFGELLCGLLSSLLEKGLKNRRSGFLSGQKLTGDTGKV